MHTHSPNTTQCPPTHLHPAPDEVTPPNFVDCLETKLDQYKLLVDDHDQRISSLELASDDLSQRVSELENVCSSLREDNAKLKAKAVDLENCSRRQNIRILGLAESTERGRPTDFFSQFLQEIFGKDTLPSPPEIDRAHRTLAGRADPTRRRGPSFFICTGTKQRIYSLERHDEEGSSITMANRSVSWRTTVLKSCLNECNTGT
ncbi:hypothetical protein WMY93_031745 [Mugilogobius chulae]|uniref:Uncharacterized protein n=1 Tax=Mugilogobius chulae TaxID=88201 RepID=A0AAW0MFD4_9GOBI